MGDTSLAVALALARVLGKLHDSTADVSSINLKQSLVSTPWGLPTGTQQCSQNFQTPCYQHGYARQLIPLHRGGQPCWNASALGQESELGGLPYYHFPSRNTSLGYKPQCRPSAWPINYANHTDFHPHFIHSVPVASLLRCPRQCPRQRELCVLSFLHCKNRNWLGTRSYPLVPHLMQI